jgi:NADH-quinone oxidoreductase subunit N
MFSLAGIPPTAGFVAKFYLFMGAVEAGMAWLAVIGVLLSAVSAYYYLRVVMVMYMREPVGRFDLATSPATQFALVVTTVAVLFFGIYPTPLIDYTRLRFCKRRNTGSSSGRVRIRPARQLAGGDRINVRDSR